MPKINMRNGYIRYTTHPIYPGIKRIDKKLATENLLLLKDILDRNNISYVLIAGTLLGIVRENDFIDHDEDIDIALPEEYRQQFFDCLHQIIDAGFNIARYDRRGLISIMRNCEYIDLYLFKKFRDDIRTCGGWLVPEKFILETSELKFKNTLFRVPKDYIGFLEYEYGINWQTPVVWNNYEMPRWKTKLLELKEKLKDLLPDKIYFFLADRSERNQEMKCSEKIEKYYHRQNKH